MRSRTIMRTGRRTVNLGVAVSLAGSLLLASLAAGMAPAAAQSAGPDIPSVGITPIDTHRTDPNLGQWFVFQLDSGQTGQASAKIVNPADVPQTVRLSTKDLSFSPDGAPQIGGPGQQSDVGAWGSFSAPSVTVPARSSVVAPFSVTVPANADPGDHAGVVMAESSPEIGRAGYPVVKRVAVRLYVTVPGATTRAFEVTSITSTQSSPLFPGYETVRVRLHNTGRIRLHPTVLVGGHKAIGADTIIAQTYEDYVARVPVGWFGGRVNEHVVVTTDSGLAKSIAHSQFVIPWGVIGAALLGLLLLYALALLIRRRQRNLAALRADIRRLEQLVAQRPTSSIPSPHTSEAEASGGSGVVLRSGSRSQLRVLETAIKRARRTGHEDTLPELALALHDAGGDALDILLEALAGPAGDSHPQRTRLIRAAATYPPERLAENGRLASLPQDLARRVTASRRRPAPKASPSMASAAAAGPTPRRPRPGSNPNPPVGAGAKSHET